MNISTQHYLEVVLLCAELLSSNKCWITILRTSINKYKYWLQVSLLTVRVIQFRCNVEPVQFQGELRNRTTNCVPRSERPAGNSILHGTILTTEVMQHRVTNSCMSMNDTWGQVQCGNCLLSFIFCLPSKSVEIKIPKLNKRTISTCSFERMLNVVIHTNPLKLIGNYVSQLP